MESSCLKNTNVANAFATLIEIANRESDIKFNKNDTIMVLGKPKKVGSTKKSNCICNMGSDNKSNGKNRNNSCVEKSSNKIDSINSESNNGDTRHSYTQDNESPLNNSEEK